MESKAGKAPKGVARIIYKQLLDGDYRKLAGESNDAPTGGGARDLRFPYAAFDGIWAKLLPQTRIVHRRRKGAMVPDEQRVGAIYLDASDATEEMAWETPNDSRNTEGRIPCVHAGFATASLLKARDPDRGEAFALFIQDDAGKLRVHYAFEDDLRGKEWDPVVSDKILDHLDCRKGRNAVCGYIDFPNDFWYAHGLH